MTCIFWTPFSNINVDILNQNDTIIVTTAWKVFKYGVFSGPYFPVFGLNTEIYPYSVRIRENTDQKKVFFSLMSEQAPKILERKCLRF